MKWEKPSFVEVKMDAEINSYQDDFRDIPHILDLPGIQDIPKPSPEVEVPAVAHRPS